MEKENKKPYTEEDIKALISEALKINIEEKKASSSRVNVETALVSTIKEFLNTFVIMGYDLNGEPLVIKYAKTHLDSDALNTVVAKYLHYIMNE